MQKQANSEHFKFLPVPVRWYRSGTYSSMTSKNILIKIEHVLLVGKNFKRLKFFLQNRRESYFNIKTKTKTVSNFLIKLETTPKCSKQYCIRERLPGIEIMCLLHLEVILRFLLPVITCERHSKVASGIKFQLQLLRN